MSLRNSFPFFLFLSAAILLLSACGGSSASNSSTGSTTLQVVAAENFYGDIAKQIGGDHVNVTSILSDPNVDPHEYESNINTAKAVAKANLVIENSGGYDDWMDKLLSASPNNDRTVLKGFDIAPTKLPDNEHIWYNVDNAQAVAQKITDTLKLKDASNTATYDKNFQSFKQSLNTIHLLMNKIKTRYKGASVGLTETIYLYQAEPMELNVQTPIEFQKALAEGNDPPANTVVTTENQVKNKQVKVLIYNEQTVSPVTTKLQNDAKAAHIPVIPVTETMPPQKTYQSWMLDQLTNLEQGLAK